MKKSESDEKCLWEERELGAEDEFAEPASDDLVQSVNAALGMKMISLRLSEDLINSYKLMASHHGVGYQPLMRDILQRFVKEGIKEVVQAQSEKSDEASLRIEKVTKKTA